MGDMNSMFIDNERKESGMNTKVMLERPCTISESIKQSCLEVKLMREGKIPKSSWREFKQRMEAEAAEGK